jgi:hypothetical protein
MTSQRKVDIPLEERKERAATLESLLQVYLAEYSAVRDELRERAEAHRRSTEYGILALGTLGAALTVFEAGLLPGSVLLMQVLPGYYLFLLLPLAYLCLLAIYVDQSHEEYAAQAYITYVLRPKVRRLLELCTRGESTDVQELVDEIWKWDVFHVQLVAGSRCRPVAGVTRVAITLLVFMLMPILVFLLGSAIHKGYWLLWEIVLVGAIAGVAAVQLRAMSCLRRETHELTKDYCAAGAVRPHLLGFAFDDEATVGHE